MDFIVAPEKKVTAQRRLQEIMSDTKHRLQHALPFAMEPVVYDFAINEQGTFAHLLEDGAALMPPQYYALTVEPEGGSPLPSDLSLRRNRTAVPNP